MKVIIIIKFYINPGLKCNGTFDLASDISYFELPVHAWYVLYM